MTKAAELASCLVLATGCAHSSVSFQPSGERWEFANNEKRVFFYGGTASTSAWDLEGPHIVWERWFSTRSWAAVSASGTHVAVVDQDMPAADARLTVLRAADGVTLLTTPVGRWQHTYETDETAFLALSFDGSWVAVSGGTPADKLILSAVPGMQQVLFHEDGDSIDHLAFDPHHLRLAVSWKAAPTWLDLYEFAHGTWERSHRWSDAHCSAWTDRGLAFAAKDGFHIFDGDRDVAFTPADLQANHEECGTWRFSPDGAWLLRWTGWTLTVANVTRPTMLHHDWEKKWPDNLCGTAFAANRLRVFTCNGLLVDFDLATLRVTREEDFGLPAVYGKDLVGAASRINYTPGLSPSGDWIVLRKPSGLIQLYK